MTIIATQGNTMFTMLKKLKLSQSALNNSNFAHSKKPSSFQKILFSVLLLISGLGFSLQASADFVVGGTCNIADPVNPPANVTDCSGQDLDGADLSGINLSHANFSNAVLTNVLFDTSDFTNARFSGVDWTGASFAGVTWDNTICPDDTNSNQYLNDGNGCLGTFTDDDGDGVRNSDDAFPSSGAASVDSDGDGHPDFWNKDCDSTCQSGSGLSIDFFPGNVAASQDDDKDGFPEVWNGSCDVTCQVNSGLALDAGQHAAGAIFVDVNTPTPYGFGADGLSWSTAWPNIGDALAVVSPGQEIWIAQGVYYPDEAAGANTDSVVSAFLLVDHVALVGGFVGNETEASAANPEAHPVVLSGDIEQNDTNVNVDGIHTGFESVNTHNGNNSHLIVNSSSVSARLTGLIISGGGSGVAGNEAGGGIYCVSTQLTLQNVKMFYNRAISTGGAISCHNANTKLVLEDVQIDNNYVGTSGGGININNGGQLKVNRSSITNNKANSGGGINLSNGSKAAIVNSTIAYNTANVAGGIRVHGSGSITAPKNLKLILSTVAFNNATVSDAGGLHISNFADVGVLGSVVVGNTAVTSGAGNVYRTTNDLLSSEYSAFGSNTDGQLYVEGIGSATLVQMLTSVSTTAFIPTQTTAALIDNTLVNMGGFTSLLPTSNASPLKNAIYYPECGAFTEGLFFESYEDQRGFPRPYEYDVQSCDIGSYEVNDFDGDAITDNFDNDIDGDTMSNDFETANGLDPYNPADATLDPDGDTIPNNADAFPNNIAASQDNDGDGYPDLWNVSCDLACITGSGLSLDHLPGNFAASQDSDDDGFPDAWNPGCDAGCQGGSGLVLDAGQLYVDSSKLWAGSDGLSWATAFPNIEDALAVASPGQEIWIAQGVYYPDEVGGGNSNSVDASFNLVDQVNLLGGFAGGETQRDDANFLQHKVVLSGDITQNDTNVDVNGIHTGYESSYVHNGTNSHVIVSGSGVNSRMMKLIISGGGSGTGPNNNGAGITCTSCELYLYKVKLFYNRTILDGGAIYISNSGSEQIILEDVLIEGSYSQNGYGGGIYVSGGLLDIHRSTIAFNTAQYGGGISTQNGAKAVINNSTLSNNISIQRGGGMYIVGSGAMSGQPYLQMNMSTVAFNQASIGGGGLWTTNSVDSYVEGSVFVGNTSSSNGANIYRGSVDVFEADYSSFGSASDGGLSVQGSNATITTFLSSGFNPTVTIPGLGTAGLINNTLEDNGGFTPTLSFPYSSTYRNAIPLFDCQQIFNSPQDQRGFFRPYMPDTDSCDLGALELNDFDADTILDHIDPDDDNDGMGDSFEELYGLDPFNVTDASGDNDGDTLTNLQEFTLGRNPNIPDTSEAEMELVISPRYHRYGYESATCQTSATPVTYTIENKDPIISRDITGTIGFFGSDWQLKSGQDFCSNTTIAPSSSCTFEVVFCGSGVGNSAGMITVPTDDIETPTLTSALFNYESDMDEAQRRLPPVLSNLVIRDSSLVVITDGQIKGGEDHTFEWTITGYHPDYQSLAAVFNCNLVIAGTCGSNFSSNVDDSGMRSPDIVDVGTWTYNGIVANTFTYTATFNLPYNVAESNEWVMRFYQIPSVDMAVSNSSLSLMIPGNIMEAAGYYDTSGRRIILNVIP